MINETQRKAINVDKPNLIPLWSFKQNDDAVLNISLFKESVSFDITGQTIRLGAKTSNGLKEQIDGFTIQGNNIDIVLKNTILVPGIVEIDLEFTDAEGKMTSASFFINVNKKVLNDTAVEATNEFDTFKKTVEEIQGDYQSLKTIIIDENNAANLQNQVNEVNASLEQITTNNRLFKPILTNFITNSYISTADGSFISYSNEIIDKRINDIIKQGFDGVQLVINLSVNSSGVVNVGSDESLNYLLTKLEDNNIPIHSIKIHGGEKGTQLKLETILQYISIETFKSQWSERCLELADKINNKTSKFIFLNELDYIYTNEEYIEFCTTLSSQLKNKGFETGISTIGIKDNFKMCEDIKSSCDLLCTNYYPFISTNGLNTSYEECETSLRNSYFIEWIKKCKKDYPTKKILLTESGVVDKEGAFIVGWKWDFINNSTNNGQIQNIYLNGMFEAFKQIDIDCVNLWWEWESELTIPTIKKYLTGGL